MIELIAPGRAYLERSSLREAYTQSYAVHSRCEASGEGHAVSPSVGPLPLVRLLCCSGVGQEHAVAQANAQHCLSTLYLTAAVKAGEREWNFC